MRKSFKVNGIDCANCAAKLERNIAKIRGVESAAVVFATYSKPRTTSSTQCLQKLSQSQKSSNRTGR